MYQTPGSATATGLEYLRGLSATTQQCISPTATMTLDIAAERTRESLKITLQQMDKIELTIVKQNIGFKMSNKLPQ